MLEAVVLVARAGEGRQRSVVVDRVRADLARFYEHEATNRWRGRPSWWTCRSRMQWEVRDAGPNGWEYHAAVLRLAS